MRRCSGISSVAMALGLCASRSSSTTATDNSAFRDMPSTSQKDASPGDTVSETWTQFETRMRFARRRIRVFDVTSKPCCEFQFIRQMCYKRPQMRQWHVRDDLCRMDVGLVEMSPSMQNAFMRIYRLKPKGEVRTALRDIVPVIEYRNTEEKQPLRSADAPEELIPQNEPDTLNQKKRELFEKRESASAYNSMRLVDERSQAKLRRSIRMKLIRFQRRIAVANAAANRSVLYSEADAMGYFLFRGPAMYAAVHRVLFELSQTLPHFVPKSMLDFGSGTGTAIMAAKEVYDPGSLAYPVFRNRRTAASQNECTRLWSLQQLQQDLLRLRTVNQEKKKARFMAVAALIENHEVELQDIPKDLQREIIEVASNAHKRAEARQVQQSRTGKMMSGHEWADDEDAEKAAKEGDYEKPLKGEEPEGPQSDANVPKKTWWEKYVDDESEKRAAAELRSQRPLAAHRRSGAFPGYDGRGDYSAP